MSGIGEYLCVDTVLKAHAVVYHLYKNKYYNKFNGKIGISLSSRFFYAKYENDTNIVDRAMQYQVVLVVLYNIYKFYLLNLK